MIDGFRYGFIGQSDAPILHGMLAVGAMNAVLWFICWRMFDTGYKLKP
jgi:ABC-2 type transport system permease protein